MGSLNIEKVIEVARKHGWKMLVHNSENKVISFVPKQRINIFYSTGTVGTCLCHPNKAKLNYLEEI